MKSKEFLRGVAALVVLALIVAIVIFFVALYRATKREGNEEAARTIMYNYVGDNYKCLRDKDCTIDPPEDASGYRFAVTKVGEHGFDLTAIPLVPDTEMSCTGRYAFYLNETWIDLPENNMTYLPGDTPPQAIDGDRTTTNGKLVTEYLARYR